MLKKSGNFFALALVIGLVASSYSQNWIKPDAKIPNHPRILWLNEQQQSIKSRVSSDSTLQSVHQIILKECNSLLTIPVAERVLKGRRLLEVSSESFRRIFFLSYAWRMTQEAKYLKRAEVELLAVAAFTDWNPSHFLDVADMTTGVAIGYDWLYSGLSATSRTIIKKALIEKGLKPSLDVRYNEWLTATTNWNQVCNAGMVLGALAIFESDTHLATQIINRAIGSIPLAMKEYGSDGNYPEGYGYWGYGTTRNVLLLSALNQAFKSDFGLTSAKGFLKTPYYLLNMVGPSGQAFNYSDNHAKVVLNPAMVWFADNLKDPSLLFEERKTLKKNKNLHRIQELPAMILWSASIDWKKIPEPKQKIWVGQGSNPVAMLRTSWKGNGIYVGLKGGSPYVNHGHMDVGSFVLDALGERWVMDFDPQSYSKLEEKGIDLWSKKQTSTRWNLYRLNNNGHSTLNINNQLQQVKGKAPITQSSTNPDFLNAVVDLSSIYSPEVKKAVRGVAIVKGNSVVVQDEIETDSKPASIKWQVLTAAKVVLKNETTAELTLNNKKMIVQLVGPKGCKLTTWSTKPKTDFEDPNAGTVMLGFEYVLVANAKTTVSVKFSPAGNTTNSVLPALTLWPKD
jgi:Heparinase II/III-like protein